MKKLLLCALPLRLLIMILLGFVAGFLMARDHFTLGIPLAGLGFAFALAPLFLEKNK